jgi:hypothetical protein
MGVDASGGNGIVGFLDLVLGVRFEVGVLEERGSVVDVLAEVEDPDHLGDVRELDRSEVERGIG